MRKPQFPTLAEIRDALQKARNDDSMVIAYYESIKAKESVWLKTTVT